MDFAFMGEKKTTKNLYLHIYLVFITVQVYKYK